MYLISLLMTLVPALAQADLSCANNPVYCDILKLRPNVDKPFARALSNSIAKYSRKFGFDPKISVAIAMQESSFSNINRLGTVLTKRNHVVHGITDVGVFQIHIETIAGLRENGSDIDIERLKVDVDYQTYWHARILKTKIAICEAQREKLQVEDGLEWSCYHSFTVKQRSLYVDLVGAHLSKIADLTH